MVGSNSGASRAPGRDEQRGFIDEFFSSALRECRLGSDGVLDCVGVRDVFESSVSHKLNICVCMPGCCDMLPHLMHSPG